MKFKNLTDEDKQYIAEVHADKELSWDERMDILKEFTGLKGERNVRKWIEKLGLSKPKELNSPQYEKAKKKKFDKKSQYFLIGYAQNNTPVHDGLMNEMEAYAKFHKASIHIIAGRYKNPTSMFSKEGDSWSSRVMPYLDANRHDIHKYMSIMSDVKIQPTAVHPLSGMQGMSKGNSCIFGHPKVHMESIPVLEGDKPKIMLTTGAVTVDNYTDSKAGKKGEFYHTLGFCIVEIKDNETFFVRQVTCADDGSFNDLYYNVKGGKVTKNKTIDTAVLGDLHYGHHDQPVIDATFKTLLKKLKPTNLVLHDVFDGHSISHHEMKNPFSQFEKEMDGTNSLKREIDNLLDFFKGIKKYNFENIIVARANHDDFIDRWLVDTDWRKTVTPKNSIEYMEYSLAILKRDAKNGIIPWILKKHFPEVMAFGRNDSYKSLGWELAQHGDRGTNGSRGSLVQFHKLATKIIVGHYHTPGRKDGALAVGTSTLLRLPYNIGPSSWIHAHVITHHDGKAQHVFFFDGEFTTL